MNKNEFNIGDRVSFTNCDNVAFEGRVDWIEYDGCIDVYVDQKIDGVDFVGTFHVLPKDINLIKS